MQFNEQANISGHLTIIKKDVQTQEETVVFDDHNIIVSGMAGAITEALTLSGCRETTECGPEYVHNISPQLFCGTLPYDINLFQVGTEGDPSLEERNTYLMGKPLVESEYGISPSLLTFHQLYAGNNGVPTVEQTFVGILSKQFYSPNTILYYMVFDETAANGHVLNECALFSQDPFRYYKPQEVPHMVAYRVFTPIKKDPSFELIIRWAIHFGLDCTLLS